MLLLFFNEVLLLREDESKLQEKESALHGNWVTAYISIDKAQLKWAGKIFFLVDCYKKHFLCTEIILLLLQFILQNGKKFSKTKSGRNGETLTPVYLCVIMQSAWESVANAIKVELTTLEMN